MLILSIPFVYLINKVTALISWWSVHMYYSYVYLCALAQCNEDYGQIHVCKCNRISVIHEVLRGFTEIYKGPVWRLLCIIACNYEFVRIMISFGLNTLFT